MPFRFNFEEETVEEVEELSLGERVRERPAPTGIRFNFDQPEGIRFNFEGGESVDDSLDRGSPTVLDSLENAHTRVTAGLGPGVSINADAFGEALAGLKQGVINFGQASRRALRDAPETGIPGLRGETAARAFDVAGQIPSSVLEQSSRLYSLLTNTDIDNNLLYHTGRAIREATRTPDEELAEEDFADAFERALLQTGAFALGGKTAAEAFKVGTKAAGGIAAWLGAAVGGQTGAEDAIRFGAEPWQVDVAYWWNSGFGATEGLPISKTLGRIDDLSGGILSRRLKGDVGTLIRHGVSGALEEGLQEIAQTFGENWTAKDLAMYDPNRSYGENLTEAAAIGGSVGMLMSLVTAGMGIKKVRAFDQRLKEDVLDPLGIDESELGGAFESTSDAYARIQRVMAALDKVKERTSELDTALDEEFRETLETARLPEERRNLSTLDITQPAILEDEALVPEDLADSVEKGVKAFDLLDPVDQTKTKRFKGAEEFLALLEVNKELEGDVPVLERIQATPVVAALTKHKSRTEGLIKRFEEAAKDQEVKGIIDDLTTDYRVKLRILNAQLAEERKIAKAAKNLFATLRTILPDSRFIINNTTGDILEGAKKPSGGHTGVVYLPGENAKGERNYANFIYLNTDLLIRAAGEKAALMEVAADKKEAIAGIEEAQRNLRSQLLSYALHEFGHAYAFEKFGRMIARVMNNTSTEEERKFVEGVTNDYKRFIADNLTSPAQQTLAKMFTLSRVRETLIQRDLVSQKAPLMSTYFALTNDDSQFQLGRDAVTFYNNQDTVEYLFSLSEYFAEEFAKVALGTARDLTNAHADAYFKDSVKDIRKVLARAKGKFGATSPTLAAYFKQHSMRQRLKSAIKDMQDNKRLEPNPLMALAKVGVTDKETMRTLSEEQDTFNWFMDLGFNILQIAERNPHIIGLQNYVVHLRQWKNEVNNNLAIAEERLQAWKDLGQRESEQLGRLLTDETIGRLPDGGWLSPDKIRNFTPEEIAAYKLSDQALELREKIKEDFKRALNQMQEVLVQAKQHIFRDNPAELQRELQKLNKEFKDMRSRPYFPLMRFGEYTLQVYSKGDQRIDGQNYKDGQIVEWITYDTEKERDQAFKKIRRSMSPEQVQMSKSKLVLPNFSLQGMPLTMLEHLESKLQSSTLGEGLPDAVKEAIKQVKNDVLPFKSFRKQFQRRKRVMGYSHDAMRAYANYMTSFSNHIARVKFDRQFKEDFEAIDDTIKVINRREGGDSTDRAKILNHMREHLDYVMNPVNEFVGIRSAAFFWFLGYNVKSAFVNLTQIPLVTYPYLAARYGDAKAVGSLTRAYGTVVKLYTKPDAVKDEGLKKMVEKGLAESWLDESLATELALAASEKNLDKSLPRKVRQKAWLKLSHYGSLPFHAAEKLNRHVAAVSAYRLAIANKKTHEQATIEARRAVEKTQFEYARWARPKFTRGKVGGTVFVFYNYLQNALYFALGGDPGAFRMMMMLLLVAGLQGIPFGENIMDLVDAGMTALKEKTGAKDPQSRIRVELRKLMKELEVNPDLVLHGLSSSTFGFANIGEFMGWPIPDLDLSGSLSMGRVIPGTELLQPGQDLNFEKTVARGIERTGGAAVSGIMGVGQALMTSHPDQWKRWEKAMPSAMRQISKGARYMVRGEEATRSGHVIAGFDHHDTRDQAEAVAQMLGFTPRDVTRGWEGFIAKQQAVMYYETRKTAALRQWNYARETGDKEAEVEANKEIRKYNSQVPFPEMKIGYEVRRNSWDSYIRTRKFNERDIEQSKASRRLSSSIQAVFEEGDNQDTP